MHPIELSLPKIKEAVSSLPPGGRLVIAQRKGVADVAMNRLVILRTLNLTGSGIHKVAIVIHEDRIDWEEYSVFVQQYDIIKDVESLTVA
jgi:hypothetical protein